MIIFPDNAFIVPIGLAASARPSACAVANTTEKIKKANAISRLIKYSIQQEVHTFLLLSRLLLAAIFRRMPLLVVSVPTQRVTPRHLVS